MLDLLSSWAKRYITQSEDTGSDADIQRHGSFYSVCQALFYVFAFRHKQLLSLPKGLCVTEFCIAVINSIPKVSCICYFSVPYVFV